MTRLYSNNAETTLAAELTAGATTMTVVDGSVFPSPGAGENFFATLDDEAGTYEIVLCTARTGNSLTITRAQQGTAALTWPIGSLVEQRVTALEFAEFVAITDGSINLTGDLTIQGELTVEGDVSLTTPLGVASGGTGAATLPANALLVGNGTAAVEGITPAANKVVTSQGPGTTWAAEDEGAFITRTVTKAKIETALSSPNDPLAITAGGTGQSTFDDGVVEVAGGVFRTFTNDTLPVLGATKFLRYRYFRNTAVTGATLDLATIIPADVSACALIKVAGAGGGGGIETGGASSSHKPNGYCGGDGSLSIGFYAGLTSAHDLTVTVGAGGAAAISGPSPAGWGGDSQVAIPGRSNLVGLGGIPGANVQAEVNGWGFVGEGGVNGTYLENRAIAPIASGFYGFVDMLFEYYRMQHQAGTLFTLERDAFELANPAALVPAVSMEYLRDTMMRPPYGGVSYQAPLNVVGYGGGGRGGRGSINAWWVVGNANQAPQAGAPGWVEIELYF